LAQVKAQPTFELGSLAPEAAFLTTPLAHLPGRRRKRRRRKWRKRRRKRKWRKRRRRRRRRRKKGK
jgi:hypothetical protein